MKTLATLEADLWLAQRANRRNPSEENQAAIEFIEAEIAKFTAESADTQAPKETKTNTSDAIQVETSPELSPAESADAQAPKETKENTSDATQVETLPALSPAESAEAQAPKETKAKKQSAPKKKEQEVK